MNADRALQLNAALDVVLAAVVFVALRSMLSFLNVPKPASIAVLITLVLVTARLWQLGITWRELGLARPESIGLTAIIAVAVYLSVAVGVTLFVNPVADALGWPPQAFHKLGDLQGNLPYLIFMIVAVGWGAAAFGEELLFRGFLLNRMKSFFGGGHLAVLLAIIGQAVLFGLGHLYLGFRGALTAGTVGLVFGAYYVATGSNLWPLIVAHGITDTIGLYALYAGLVSNT